MITLFILIAAALAQTAGWGPGHDPLSPLSGSHLTDATQEWPVNSCVIAGMPEGRGKLVSITNSSGSTAILTAVKRYETREEVADNVYPLAVMRPGQAMVSAAIQWEEDGSRRRYPLKSGETCYMRLPAGRWVIEMWEIPNLDSTPPPERIIARGHAYIPNGQGGLKRVAQHLSFDRTRYGKEVRWHQETIHISSPVDEVWIEAQVIRQMTNPRERIRTPGFTIDPHDWRS